MSEQLDIPKLLADRQAAVHKALREGSFNPNVAQALRHSVRVLGSSPVLFALGNDPPADQVIVDEKKMSVTLPISTARVDRMGDIVVPKGCLPHLANYERNPRVFFSHRSNEHPIGSARHPDDGSLALSVDDGGITSTCYFHGETSESEVIFRLVKRKELQAASIGFLPVKATVMNDDDDDDEPYKIDGEKVVLFGSWMPLRFLEWDLTEWSIVPIPANPDACESLTIHLERGHVEGEAIPQSVRKALEPFKLKARVWSPGFNPESNQYTGILALGERELEYDGGKLKRIDDHEFKEQQEVDDVDVFQVTEGCLEDMVERAVKKTMSALDDTDGGSTVSPTPEHEGEEIKLLREVKDLLQKHVERNDRVHQEILDALKRLEVRKLDEEGLKAKTTSDATLSILADLRKGNEALARRLERITGGRR